MGCNMGLNSIHSNPQDQVFGRNLSNETEFKCTLVTSNLDKYEVVQGVEFGKIECVILINGHSEINIGDYISLPIYSKKLSVKNTKSNVNQQLFRKRIDVENFTGITEVALG